MNKYLLIKILSWLIPLISLGILIYLDPMKFGLSRHWMIEVGSDNDEVGAFRIEKNQALGSRQKEGERSFRTLDGLSYAIWESPDPEKNYSLKARLEGEGVSFVLAPYSAFTDISEWNADNIAKLFSVERRNQKDYKYFANTSSQPARKARINPGQATALSLSWLASKEAELLRGDLKARQDTRAIYLSFAGKELAKIQLPDYFIDKEHQLLIGFGNGEVYVFLDKEPVEIKNKEEKLKTLFEVERGADISAMNYHAGVEQLVEKESDCIKFDGETRYFLPDSADRFDNGAFAVKVVWQADKKENSQQIIGHFNWELYQDEKAVQFRIGRMYDKGPFYSISQGIEDDFFGRKHELIAVYSPATNRSQNGYIELFVDGKFSGRKYFAEETIWKDYGKSDLSLGWSQHSSGKNPYFQGLICSIALTEKTAEQINADYWELTSSGARTKIPIWGVGEVSKLELEAKLDR